MAIHPRSGERGIRAFSRNPPEEGALNADRGTSLFWILVAIVVAVASFRLGLGKISEPGSGFLPFWASVLLGLLSIVCFFQGKAKQKRGAKAGPLFKGSLWPRVLIAFFALVAYAQLIPFGGYNVTTFFLMAFLFWLAGRQKLWRVAVYSAGTTLITYYVFSRTLNLQFPPGPLGF